MGLYGALENKWYNVLDALDGKLHIYKIVDPIDKIVPSFILFLIVIIALIAGGAYILLSAGVVTLPWPIEIFPPSNDSTISITVTSGGIPVSGATVSVLFSCNGEQKELSVATSSSGISKFAVCDGQINIHIEKNGFLAVDDVMAFPDEKEKAIELSNLQMPSKDVTVRIVDSSSVLISAAQLDVICTTNGVPNRKQVTSSRADNRQPSDGFKFTTESTCDSISLVATAASYSNKTADLLLEDYQKTISLERIVQTGTAVFSVNSPIGALGTVQIIVTDNLGLTSTLYTTTAGQVTQLFNTGNYTFSAFKNGFTKTGSFVIEADKTSDVAVYFSDINSINPIITPASKKIHFKLFDANTPITTGAARIYLSKGRDTNLINIYPQQADNTFGPQNITDLNASYYAIVKVPNYITSIVSLTKLGVNDAPQSITLQQGGIDLTIKVIDDIGQPVVGATTKIYSDAFPAELEPAALTDVNGIRLVSGLRGSGSHYTISAETITDVAEKTISLPSSGNTVTIQLKTGSGALKLHFISSGVNTSPSFKLQLRDSDGKWYDDSNLKAVSGVATTRLIQALSDTRIVVDDINYLPYESMSYKITRGVLDKYIYLHKVSDLPNTNQVQLILRKVSNSDPVVSTETTPTTKLMQGENGVAKAYYFLFDLVITKPDTNIAASYVRVIKEATDSTAGMLIQSLQTVDTARVSLHNDINADSIFVDYANLGVAQNAVHALMLDYNRKAPVTIPIVVKVTVPEGATGKEYVLSWAARFGNSAGNINSVVYTKKFTIGTTFCFSDCNAFAFDSFLYYTMPGRDANIVALDGNPQDVQTDNNYSILTTVQNLSDRDYGDGNLVLSIPETLSGNSQMNQYLSFASNSYVATSIVDILPQEIVTSSQKKIFAKKGFGIIPIRESIGSVLGNSLTVFENLIGNGSDNIRLNVKNKKRLNIDIINEDGNNVWYSNKSYYNVVIRVTVVDPVTGVASIPSGGQWSASVGQTSITGGSNLLGAGGVSSYTFPRGYYPAGTKLVFWAGNDNDNSASATREIIIEDSALINLDTSDCLTLKLKGVPIKNIQYPSIDINVPGTTSDLSLSIDSNCSSDRTILVSSVLGGTTPFSYYLYYPAGNVPIIGGSGTISAGAKDRNILITDFSASLSYIVAKYGANPILITTNNGTSQRILGQVDIVINDTTGPFSLSKYIYDFSNSVGNVVSATLRNNRYQGYRDPVHPDINVLNKPEVTLDINGAIAPTIVSFDVNIDTVGVEAALVAYVTALTLTSTMDAQGKISDSNKLSVPEVKFKTDANNLFKDYKSVYGNASTTLRSTPTNINSKTMAYKSMTTAEKESVDLYQNYSTRNRQLALSSPTFGNLALTPTSSDLSIYDSKTPTATALGSVFDTYPGIYMPGRIVKDINYRGFKFVQPSTGITNLDIGTGWSSVYDGLSKARMMVIKNTGCKLSSNKLCAAANVTYDVANQTFNAMLGTTKSAAFSIKEDLMREILMQREVVKSTTKKITFDTSQGIYCTTDDYNSSIATQWVGATGIKVLGQAPTYATRFGYPSAKPQFYVNNIGLQTLGFIPLEYTAVKEGTGTYPYIPKLEDPTVEFHISGANKNTFSKITSSIPPGYRVFLKDGKICAELKNSNGKTPDGNTDFTITRVKSLSTGYADIMVTDYIAPAGESVQRLFKVKLIGSQANCTSSTGINGNTGPSAVPRVLYNWNWGAVDENACNSDNNNYVYCDAVQFNISLFKRLNLIDQKLVGGDLVGVTELTAFDAYLMKDAYPAELLNDFKQYYSDFANNGASFPKLSNFINVDKNLTRLKFKINNNGVLEDAKKGLLVPGLYSVGIDLNYDTPYSPALFDNFNSPTAIVTVSFTLKEKAKTNVPIYSLPFDGTLGLINGVRHGYGAAAKTGLLLLNRVGGINATDSNGSFIDLKLFNDTNLTSLDKGEVFIFDKDLNQITLMASQPTPVEINVIASNGVNATMAYSLTGYNQATTLTKKWQILGSTVDNGCKDFSGQTPENILDSVVASNNSRVISWANASISGKLVLGTVFYTPPLTVDNKAMTLGAVAGDLNASAANGNTLVTGGKSVQLLYFDAGGVTNYDSLAGMFKLVRDGNMCISNEDEGKVVIWWNPAYLKTIFEKLPVTGATKCVRD
ncbi:MAG: hypothetical protein WCI04_01110 [archaeon]